MANLNERVAPKFVRVAEKRAAQELSQFMTRDAGGACHTYL
jgi:hypothetical protein